MIRVGIYPQLQSIPQTSPPLSCEESKKNIFTINNIFYQLNPETWNWKFGKKSRKQTRDNIETEAGGWMQIFDMGHEIWLGGLKWQKLDIAWFPK